MKRFLWLGLVVCVYVICTGCGDTFRPIIIPNPPVFPNPMGAHTVVAISDNAPQSGPDFVQGTAMVIDVSGDTDESIANVGIAPVYAVQQSASQVLVVNHASTTNPSASLTQLNFSGTTISNTSTITLPPNSGPNFVAVAPSSTIAFVTFPNLSEIGVVNTVSQVLVSTSAVGTNPDAAAVTPDNTKLYVANYGSNSVSGFNIVSQQLSPRTVNGSFNGPLWLITRSDNQRLYVLGSDGVVSTVDTTSSAGPDNVIDTSISVPGAIYMLYDSNLNRLYIPGTSQLDIVDISTSTPGVPVIIPVCQGTQTTACISIAPSSSRAAGDPCLGTAVNPPLTLVGVAALPDGSRAYVGAYYLDSNDNVCPQVTVIDAVSETVKSFTPVVGFPDATVQTLPGGMPDPYYSTACATTRFRFMMAAAGDSSRAYLSSCDGGNVNVIDTSTDTYILNIQAPIGTRPPIPPSGLNQPQNPVFLLAGP
jgi:DNA-binding beta-propeller fold protein YncE